MNIQRPSCALAVVLIATQVLGPAVLWAADQRGIRVEENRRVVIAAISGEQLTVQNGSDTKPLNFREAVNAGDQIATGDRTVAEVLIGNRAVVTLGQGTRAQVTAVSENQATVQVQKGSLRVAASAMALGGQGKITVQTPTGQVQTRGGIIRVMVDAPIGSAEQLPIGAAKPYQAAYSPSTMVAAANTRGDIIQVEEGTAEIPGAGSGGGTLTVKSGQAVTLQSGQVGPISGLANQAGLSMGVLASAGHSKTPKEGLANLVALQVNQATSLGKALTGAAETGGEKSGRTDDKKNVINGTTGGVVLQSTSTSTSANAFAATFGSGGLLSGTAGIERSRTGTGVVDDSNDAPDFIQLSQPCLCFSLTGTSLLKFGGRFPVVAVYDGVGDVTKDSSYRSVPGVAVASNFSVFQELLFVDGGPLVDSNDKPVVPHGGKAPTNALIARGISGSNLNLPLQVRGSFGSIAASDGIIRPERFRDGQIRENAMVVVENLFSSGDTSGSALTNLADFSSRPDGVIVEDLTDASGDLQSYVTGSITARSPTSGNRIVELLGGVEIGEGTSVSLGGTFLTPAYYNFKIGLGTQDLKFDGSLLIVSAGQNIEGFSPAFARIHDRALSVRGGSVISGEVGSNVALLSVLDSRFTGPSENDRPFVGPFDLLRGTIPPLMEMVDSSATVTSAVVVRSTDVVLDGALLSASSPLLAMMNATMTTTSHFADLAGNNGQHALVASLVPGDALVRLDHSSALTMNGNLLNLNNATASVTGYLFSLNNGSTLTLNNGALFSLTNGSSLNLTGNAFGVFGSGTNTLSIDNNLCTATCFQLVNSANQPFLLPNGTPLHVAGATQNVVWPNNFNVFALAPGAAAPNANIIIGADDALFKVDSTSTLTINGSKVQ